MVALGTATTILEIGISFPTIVRQVAEFVGVVVGQGCRLLGLPGLYVHPASH
jgi:hypothetical protein